MGNGPQNTPRSQQRNPQITHTVKTPPEDPAIEDVARAAFEAGADEAMNLMAEEGVVIAPPKQPNWFIRAWRATKGWFARLFRKAGHGVKTGYRASTRVLVTGFTYVRRGGEWVLVRTGLFLISIPVTLFSGVSYLIGLPMHMGRSFYDANRPTWWLDEVDIDSDEEIATGRVGRREQARVRRSRRTLTPTTV